MELTPDSISGTVSSMPLSPQSSPVIKRSAVTYGRRREHVSDADTSTSTVLSTLSSRAGSHVISSPSIGDEVPASSDEYDALDSSVLRSGGEDVSDQDEDDGSSFVFPWRKDLQNLDYDYEAKAPDSGARDAPFNAEGGGRTGRPPSQSDKHEFMLQAEGHGRTSRKDENQGPLPSLIDFTQSANHSASRSPSPVVRRRRNRPAAPLNDSDDEFSASPLKLQHRATRSSLSSPGLASLETSPDRGQDKGKQRAVEAWEASDEQSEAVEDVSQRKSNRKRPSGKPKEKRTKAPTRKEREETQKATARIVADRPVSIPRVQMKQMPITQLFQKLERVVNSADERVMLRSEGSISDPIQPFSSSPAMDQLGSRREARSMAPSSSTLTALVRSPETHVVDSFVPNGLLGPGPSETNPFHGSDSSEDEMPDIGALLEEDAAKRTDKEKWTNLTELKLQLLEKQQIDQLNASDDDDDCELVIVHGDMQLVAKEEAQARRAMEAQGLKHSVGRQNQIAHAGRHVRLSGTRQLTKANELLPRGRELDLLKAAAGSTFGRQAQETRDHPAIQVNKHHLNKYLLRNAQQQAEEATRLKEEEWVRRGGRIKGRSGDDGQMENAKSALLAVVHKGLSMKQGPDEDSAQDDGDEEDDPDYEDSGDENKPTIQEEEHGDQSPGPEAVRILEDRETEVHEDNEDEGSSLVVYRQRGRSRRPFATVHSDEEDEESDIPASSLRGRMLAPDSSFALSSAISNPHQGALNHRASTSSFEDHTDNGTDKENDSRLMYDRSEDKENTAVANQFSLRLEGISARTSGLFGQGLRERSPLTSNGETDDLNIGDPPLEGHRTPLGELPRDDDDGDDPFALGSESRLPARRLLFASDVEKSVGLPHKNTGNSAGDGDEQDASTSLRSPDALKAGFSQFFGSNVTRKEASPMVPKALQAGGLSQFWTQQTTVAGFDQLRGARNEELSLTLDAGLQPALDISQGLRRKADEIFEKEQQYLAEDFARKPESKPQLYVNAHGFLTQTVPEMGLPGSSRSSSPTQVVSPFKDKDVMIPGSTARQPLAPIDSDMEIDLDDERPMRRLKKRRLSPVSVNNVNNRGGSPSPVKPRNAFEVLRQAPQFQYKPSSKSGKKLHKSEFIEGEAEESDDDNLVGFGLRKKKDEEESDDDESQDQTLAELVDDSTMDAKTLAEEAVLEKVREHQEIDDQRDERLAKEIADGKHRVKRRDHGLGYEDSESDDDDEDAKMRRRKMLKKRKIDGDSLEQLANDPRTRAFVEAYHADIVDGDDFAHLQQDEMTLVDENEQDAEDEPEMEYVSTTELTRQLREAAQEKSHQPFNPLDISWLDHDDVDNDEVLPVKEVQTRLKPLGLRRPADWDTTLEASRPAGEDEKDRARMQNWAKGESRTSGAGRSIGISAVTGGGKRKAGGGSISARGQRPTRGSQAATRSSAKVTKTSSALSAVSTSKRNKFQ